MKRQVPWMRVLGEGITIVASILLALGIESTWSDRQARAAARVDLAGVLEELDQAREEIETHGAWHQLRLEATKTIRAELEAVPTGARVTLSDSLLALAVGGNVSDPPSSLLQAFQSTGAIEDVENEELRRRLLAWTLTLEDLQADELWSREFGDDELRPYITGAFDNTGFIDVGTRMWSSQSTIFAGGQTSLESTQTLKNLMAMSESFATLTSRQAREAVDLARELAAVIEAELR